MTDVQERLGQAFTEALDRAPLTHPARVVDAGAAWDAGRLRRHRRRVGGALAVAAAVAAVTVGSVAVVQRDSPRSIAPAEGQRSGGVASYPERVDGPRPWTGDVTDAREPLAGVVWDDAFDNFGVTASGKLWSIPIDPESSASDFVPVLSADGTRLAWLRDATTFQMLDVVTGEVVAYDGIGDNRSETTEPYMTQGQVPGFFSPDGSQIAVNGWPSDPDAHFGSGWLLLDDEGGFTELPAPDLVSRAVGPAGPRLSRRPIGWADDDHLLWRSWSASGGGHATFELITASLDGEVSRVVPVPSFQHPRGSSQWTASVAPGGERVYLRGDDSLVVDAATGEVVERLAVDPPDLCSPSWRGDQVLEPGTGDAAGALLALRERRDGATLADRVAVLEPGLGSCLVLTTQALAGGPTTTLESWLVGTSTTWLSWHLDEVAAGAAGLAALLGAFFWWRRRRPRYDAA